MKLQKIYAHAPLIAGICFVIMALANFISPMFYRMNGSAVIHLILNVVGCVILAVAMFSGKRKVLPAIGAGMLALAFLITALASVSQYYRVIYILFFFVEAAAYIFFLMIVLYGTTDHLQNMGATVVKLWYLPGAALAAVGVITALMAVQYNGGLSLIGTIIGESICFAGLSLTAVWILFPERVEKKEKSQFDLYAESLGYIGIVKHILLLLFTFGIWQLIWMYRTTKHLNQEEDEDERKPVTELLLYMFIPFYAIFWNYKSALRVDKQLKKVDLGPGIANVCLFWSVFVWFLVPILMQDTINRIAMKIAKATFNPQNNPAYEIFEDESDFEEEDDLETEEDLSEEDEEDLQEEAEDSEEDE